MDYFNSMVSNRFELQLENFRNVTFQNRNSTSNFNFQYSRLSTFKSQIVCLENFVADYPKDGDVLYSFFKDRSININSIGYFHTKPRAQSGSSGRNTTESDWFFRILNDFQWITVRNHCMRQCKTWKREDRWMFFGGWFSCGRRKQDT